MKSVLITSVIATLFCAGCGLGTSSGASSIVATTYGTAASSQTPYNTCTQINGSRTCSIQLTYSSGGQSGQTISYTSSVTSGSAFVLNPTPSACPVTNSNSVQIPCGITVTPPASPATGNTESLTFSLAGQTSQVITLSN